MRIPPCYKCPKCPCKEHDTCPDFLDFRRGIEEDRKKKDEEGLMLDYISRSVKRTKRRRK